MSGRWSFFDSQIPCQNRLLRRSGSCGNYSAGSWECCCGRGTAAAWQRMKMYLGMRTEEMKKSVDIVDPQMQTPTKPVQSGHELSWYVRYVLTAWFGRLQSLQPLLLSRGFNWALACLQLNSRWSSMARHVCPHAHDETLKGVNSHAWGNQKTC